MWNQIREITFLQFLFCVLLLLQSMNDTTPIIIRSRREILDATELFIAFFGVYVCLGSIASVQRKKERTG